MSPEALAACIQGADPRRPTFCNIPEWTQYALYFAGFLAVAIFAWGVYRHWRLWLAGQPNAPDRNTGRRGERFGLALKYVLGQQGTIGPALPGRLPHRHLLGLRDCSTIGTILATVDWDVFHLFLDTQFLTGPLYLVYEVVLDTVGLLFIVGPAAGHVAALHPQAALRARRLGLRAVEPVDHQRHRLPGRGPAPRHRAAPGRGAGHDLGGVVVGGQRVGHRRPSPA